MSTTHAKEVFQLYRRCIDTVFGRYESRMDFIGSYRTDEDLNLLSWQLCSRIAAFLRSLRKEELLMLLNVRQSCLESILFKVAFGRKVDVTEDILDDEIVYRRLLNEADKSA